MHELPVCTAVATASADAHHVHLAAGAGLAPALSAIAVEGGPAARVIAAHLLGRAALVAVPGPGPLDAAAARALGALVGRSAGHAAIAVHGLGTATDGVPERPFLDGLLSAAYRFARHRTRPAATTVPERIELVLPGTAEGDARVAEALAAALADFAATALARDLVNEIPSTLTPSAFAAIAGEVAARADCTIEVLDEHALAAAGCGAILGVGRGSAEPPRLVKLATRTPDPALRIALVGKGITFDAGGLFIKSPAGMGTMKGDMAGAAAILGAISLASRVAPRVEVRAVLALAENLPGPRATKPGDVLRSRSGRTIEVNDPDCEGRIVLADALSVAGDDRPDVVVDLATLTGAKVKALGSALAALYANDDALAAALIAAGDSAGEPLWRMPLVDRYRPRLDSAIADLKVYDWAPSCPDSIHAALFLREFVPPGARWAHVDMAANEFAGHDADVPDGMATGWGARLLVELLRRFAATT